MQTSIILAICPGCRNKITQVTKDYEDAEAEKVHLMEVEVLKNQVEKRENVRIISALHNANMLTNTK